MSYISNEIYDPFKTCAIDAIYLVYEKGGKNWESVIHFLISINVLTIVGTNDDFVSEVNNTSTPRRGASTSCCQHLANISSKRVLARALTQICAFQ